MSVTIRSQHNYASCVVCLKMIKYRELKKKPGELIEAEPISRTREESILTHVKRHPVVFHTKTTAKRDGTLTAMHTVAYVDTGPYANAGPHVSASIADTSSGPYHVPKHHG